MKLSSAVLELSIRALDVGTIMDATVVGLILGYWRPEEIRDLAARADDIRADLLDGLARYFVLRDRPDFCEIADDVFSSRTAPK